MKREIRITKKERGRRAQDRVSANAGGYAEKLDELAEQTNRSRNELINLLLAEALQEVSVVEEN